MHSQFANNQPIEGEQTHLHVSSSYTDTERLILPASSMGEVTRFHTKFQDCMEMYAEVKQVIAYLDAHQTWFSRCASPMKVEPIGPNGYALLIGRFGAFGYEVEPKVGLELLPEEDGIYHIRTIPVPDYTPPGYEVDFHAAQSFVEVPARDYFPDHQVHGVKLPTAITRVEWHLDLIVSLRFPKFIQRLPQSLIQSTGDRLLHQVVRQVSHRLTHKVQEDFHTSLGLPMPKKQPKR